MHQDDTAGPLASAWRTAGVVGAWGPAHSSAEHKLSGLEQTSIAQGVILNSPEGLSVPQGQPLIKYYKPFSFQF